ncbi:MAG TPA: hypothetical protein PK379_02460 [Candidatus Hydrogenedentes bacterium]|nr:hypothetical protein [Candidatus Hydrogenedentota bacterium]
MDQVKTILWAKWRIGVHEIAGIREQSRLKVGVITTFAILLWIGIYLVFREGFDWVIRFGGQAGGANFGALLMRRILAILFLSLFVLLTFSNILVAFATLYRAKEVPYLLLAPMKTDHYFYARFAECVAFSSWSLAYLGSPILLAYGLSSGASWSYYPSLLLFYLPAVMVPAALGAMVCMVMVLVFPRLRSTTLVLLSVAVLAGFFLYVRSIIRGVRITDETVLPVFLETSRRVQAFFLPSHWVAQGILDASRGMLSSAVFWWCCLTSTAMMFTLCAAWTARFIFYPGWADLMGQDRQRMRPENRGLLNLATGLLRIIPEPIRSLCVKDVKLFWRDATQWTQFVIFFGIMAIYAANLRNSGMIQAQPFWRVWVAGLNIGSLTLILATLTSRFIYPLISLEGRRFWVLGLAPITLRLLVWQKFALSVVTSGVFTLPVAILSGQMLHLDAPVFLLTLFTVICANFGLAGLAVGLGALYPNFTEDNPARIVGGLGGTLNLLLSIGYIALLTALTIGAMYARYIGTDQAATWKILLIPGAMVLIAAITLLVSLLPMTLGLRNLNQAEF